MCLITHERLLKKRKVVKEKYFILEDIEFLKETEEDD